MSDSNSAMHRRDFLIGGIKVSISMLVLDRLGMPAFAKPERNLPSTVLPPRLNDSIEVMANYLATYAPPIGESPASGAWKATYALMDWSGTPHAMLPRNDVTGRLTMTRRPDASASKIGYVLDYMIRMNGWDTTMKSDMECSADPLPRLLKWQLDYENHSVKDPSQSWKLSEQGEHRNGVLEIASKAGTRRFNTARPVVPQWAVIDAVRTARQDPSDPIANVEFDLLHDLTSYRPGQRIKPCGTMEVALNGQSYQFHGFLQTGHGSEPTHYWVDSSGRPLLITGGMVSCAMTSVEAA